MNVPQLKELLDREGYRKDCYDLNGGLRPERYTLGREGDLWTVYCREHGVQSGKRFFPTEAEACEYFLAQLRAEPHAKQG